MVSEISFAIFMLVFVQNKRWFQLTPSVDLFCVNKKEITWSFLSENINETKHYTICVCLSVMMSCRHCSRDMILWSAFTIPYRSGLDELMWDESLFSFSKFPKVCNFQLSYLSFLICCNLPNYHRQSTFWSYSYPGSTFSMVWYCLSKKSLPHECLGYKMDKSS